MRLGASWLLPLLRAFAVYRTSLVQLLKACMDGPLVGPLDASLKRCSDRTLPCCTLVPLVHDAVGGWYMAHTPSYATSSSVSWLLLLTLCLVLSCQPCLAPRVSDRTSRRQVQPWSYRRLSCCAFALCLLLCCLCCFHC